jgi:NAD(P)-dependent dehydrogenase (short-subunit alcohol dehydrogenase family)
LIAMPASVRYDFSGNVVLITGAASGIGAATARACAGAGGTVIAVDVNAEGLERLAAETARVVTRPADVGNPQQVRGLIAEIERDRGRIDAAVLAAAIQVRTPIESISDEEWQRHMAVNVGGAFHVMREVAPIMKRQGSGAMVCFTSGLVGLGWPGTAAYAASKGALLGLAKSAAVELRPYRVRVNVLSPGLVATPIFLGVASSEEVAMYERSVGVSEADEVVPSVLYLISEASSNLTGAVLERRLVPGK